MSQKKVLVADDEPNILISLEYLMKREGHLVIVARDGVQALDAIRREKPDLVLLDVMMPGKTGFEVAQAVRADEVVGGREDPHAHRQGPRHRCGAGPGRGRRRVHDEAVRDAGTGGEGARDAGCMKLDS